MRVGIIGAGATGLSAAMKLSVKHDVTVFEKAGLGGLAGAVALRDTAIDKYYHHIFTSDEYIIRLIDEMGLGGDMLWKPANNGLYMDSRLYPFTNPADLLLFPKVSLPGRLRMGLTVLGAKRIRDFRDMETINAKEWIIKKSGRSAYEAMWAPLLYSKFGSDADDVSGVWIWNKFKLRGSSRKGIGKEYLGYLRGGFIALYDKMAENLEVREEPVKRIEQRDGKILLITDGREELFDKVIYTAAAGLLSELCDFQEQYRDRLLAQKHKANICMTLIVSKPISDYYWITVADKEAPYVLMIEHTNMFDDPAYRGDKVVYLSRYLDAADPVFKADDEAIREAFLSYLKKMFPGFSRSDVIDSYINREAYAQPVVYQRHSERILPFETPVEGLYLANMGQIYPEDRGQNYAVRLGLEVAEIIDGGTSE